MVHGEGLDQSCGRAASTDPSSIQCDLAGGHIRNIVLAAAALSRARNDVIGEPDLLIAAAAEYRKLGKTVPAGLTKPAHGNTG